LKKQDHFSVFKKVKKRLKNYPLFLELSSHPHIRGEKMGFAEYYLGRPAPARRLCFSPINFSLPIIFIGIAN